jgi:hypothetical protein
MTETIVRSNGEMVSQVFRVIEEEKAHIIENIKLEAERLIQALEGGPSRFKRTRAEEQDQMTGGFQYQRLIHEIEVIRKRSNDLEAIVNSITDVLNVVEFDYITPMIASIDIGAVPAVLDHDQFMSHVFPILNADPAVANLRYGEALIEADTLAATNGHVASVMSRFRTTPTIDKVNAGFFLNALQGAGATKFSAAELADIINTWPEL